MSQSASAIIVRNTSPIFNLAAIGQPDLLQRIYGKILVPQAVYDEVVRGMEQLQNAGMGVTDWIETRTATNQAMVSTLELELDRGEAEAIALAIDLDAALLLVDERKGRSVASRLGIRVIGLLGILVQAKQNGLVPKVRPLLDRLIQQAGFWIGEELYNRVLSSVDESNR